MTHNIDLSYRPDTFFRPQKLEQHLLSKVKSAVIRKRLQALFAQGRHAEVRDLLTTEALSARDRKALEEFHPMYMGGNYLPDTEDGEVEIARISIASTTSDVTCVYARPDEGAIHYRVVDEYGGDTLQGCAEAQTDKPMTLGEFAEFFMRAWPLIDLLDMSFEGDQAGALDFFSAESDFYPDFDQLCRQRVCEHFPDDESESESESEAEDEDEWQAGDHCPFCNYFNSPPAADTCEHICAWVWDGNVEALGHGCALNDALSELRDLAYDIEEKSVGARILKIEAQSSPIKAALIKATAGDFDFVATLQALGKAELGSRWSTKGMLGGSGYSVFVPDPKRLLALHADCHGILKASAIQVETLVSARGLLEAKRPPHPIEWQPVASGYWSEDVHHSGHIAYFVANTNPGEWLMESVERNTELDDVTEEDVEEGRLNDDQIQAMWGKTLEDAQSSEYRQIIAACSGASSAWDAEQIAAVLYQAACIGGGKRIDTHDQAEGLLGL